VAVKRRPVGLVHADDDKAGIELGLRVQFDSRLGNDAQVLRARAAQDAIQRV
jgi:hypothetical protein